LLASRRLAGFLDEARRAYDVILLDSSPLLAVTDPLILAAAADGIVLVARVTDIRRHEAERTAELLRALRTPVLGTVINGVRADESRYGYKFYMASCSPDPLEGPIADAPEGA
jgi:Mrp family chromosome partitioning ATPase